MLQLLYILAFTVLAFLAVGNLIRNLLMFSSDVNRPTSDWSAPKRRSTNPTVTHPEMLDDAGSVIREPLLVMKSMTLEDARNQLDAMYDASDNPQRESEQ